MPRLRLGLTALCASCVFAQTVAFEVASVKMLDPKAPRSYGTVGGPGSNSPGRVHFRSAPILELITTAYGVTDGQVSGGPGWLSDLFGPRYEVIATMSAGTTKGEFQLMMQHLLAERFALSVHRVQRDFRSYDLVVASGGPKLKSAPSSSESKGKASTLPSVMGIKPLPAVTNENQALASMSNGRLRAFYERTAMAKFAGDLGRYIALSEGLIAGGQFGKAIPQVTDKTGLVGVYSFVLDCACASCGAMAAGPAGAEGQAPDGDTGPTIFKALEKDLGLRLVPRMAPLEVIVVDKINKTPSAN